MKNVKKLVLMGAVCSMLFLGACNDDTTDPVPGEGTTKNCKIASTSDEDGTVMYTWDGDNITKVVEESDGETTTYNYNYEGGKLTEIVEDWDGDIVTYTIVYDGDKVSRVDVSEDGEVYEYYNIKWNTDGTLMMVDNFYKEDMADVLWSGIEYTYADGRLQEFTETVDSDEDGDLDGDDEYTTYKIKAVDDKINPFYGIPSYLMDFTDMLSLTKNNINAATIGNEDLELPITATYEYNSDNYPTKGSMNALGETLNIAMTYTCE